MSDRQRIRIKRIPEDQEVLEPYVAGHGKKRPLSELVDSVDEYSEKHFGRRKPYKKHVNKRYKMNPEAARSLAEALLRDVLNEQKRDEDLLTGMTTLMIKDLLGVPSHTPCVVPTSSLAPYSATGTGLKTTGKRKREEEKEEEEEIGLEEEEMHVRKKRFGTMEVVLIY